MKINCEENKIPTLITLTDLFKFKLKVFRIPDYQRGYSWGRKKETKQLNDLWNDIENIDGNSCHFTGTITLEKITPNSKWRWEKEINSGEREFDVSDNLTIYIENTEYTPYFVVDGQQRLVSLMILLSLLSKEDKLLDKKEEAQRFVSIVGNGKTHYLFGYEKDTQSHQFLIRNIFEDHSMEITEPETLYTQNLTRAKDFFKLKLKDLNGDKKNELYKKITEQLLFNIFEIKSEELDISLVFETLNYRGKPLSKLELFKNRLILLITKRYGEKSKGLRENVINTWKYIYEWLGKNKEKELDDDDFLKAFWVMFYNHHGKTDKKFQEFEHDIFENKYKISDVKKNDFLLEYGKRENHFTGLDKLLEKLTEAVKYWFFIHNPDFEFQNPEQKEKFNYSPEIKKFLRKLDRNTSGGFMKPLILAYFINFQSKENFDLLKQIERHNYCVYLFAGRPADTNRSHFYEKANKFFINMISLQSIIAEIRTKTDEWLKLENVYVHIHRSRAKNKQFWDWNGIKYTLWEWEESLQGENEPILPNYLNSSTYLIYPTSRFSFGKNYVDPVRRGRADNDFDKLRYSLGNISINKKQKSLNGNIKLKEKDISQSYSDIDKDSNYKEWTDKTIFQRGLQMLAFIEENWNIEYK